MGTERVVSMSIVRVGYAATGHPMRLTRAPRGRGFDILIYSAPAREWWVRESHATLESALPSFERIRQHGVITPHAYRATFTPTKGM